MNYKEIIFKYLVIILIGALIFYLDNREFFEPQYTTWLVLLLAFIKLSLLFYNSYKKIIYASLTNIAFHKFLIFMLINVAVLIISFAVDFLCLYEINPSNFEGLPDNLTLGELLFEFIYFSMLGFNNLGFYDVIPKSLASKALVIMEIISYFSTIIFVLSDFISLKESIVAMKEREDQGEKKY